MIPTKEQAWQFALMTHSGMPAVEALRYFFGGASAEELQDVAAAWSHHELYRRAILQLQGKAFQDLTLQERIQRSLDVHYAQLAYYLYSRNYTTLTGIDRQKADICRSALEAKLAGNAGQMNPLVQFWQDIKSGKIALGGPTTPSTIPLPETAH